MTDQRPPLDALGVPTYPFSDTPEEFFGEGDRSRQLDELRHLARWSRRLLAVTGERGVGKSTLYRALSGGLDPGVKAARINANLTSDTREVLAGIIHGFGMAAPANADPQLLIALIVLHVNEQIDANRHCLVLIDDAHLLELRALEQLLRLTEGNADEGLRIVFFAEPYFVQSLDKAARRTSQVQNWHEIRLAPFTEEESRRYVAFRLQQAGLQDRSPLTQNQLSVIVGGSSGLPGRINELARAILSGELTINDERRWLPRMHRALVVLVVIAAGMGWLIFDGYPERKLQTAEESSVAGQASEAVGEKSTGTLAIDLPPTDVLSPSPPAATPALATTEPAEPVTEELPAPARETKLPRRVPEPKQIALVDTPAAPSNDRQAPVVERMREPVATDSSPKPSSVASAVAGRPQSVAWIRQQPGNHFTLQLFATSSREKRDRFVAQQVHPERFAILETRRNGVSWYAVTYGDYTTRAEANAASASLPPLVGRVEPWVRTFASVQAALD
jgi:DamX protein